MDLKTRVEILPCGTCEDMMNCDDCYHQKEAKDIYQQIRADAIDECIDELKHYYDDDSWCIELLEQLKKQNIE